MAKPFLKWAGGKTQLIDSIEQVIPEELYSEEFTYIEPFLGSGAVYFWMLKKFPNMKQAILNDINMDLINCFKTIKCDVDNLISILKEWEHEYHGFEDNVDNKKNYFYEKRGLYNLRTSESLIQSALFIFLNRTCFNGLYRVNRKNEFNVPIGSYKKPLICNESNLLNVSKSLENVELLCGDYRETLKLANGNTFYYLDPPYKPLTNTSNFNSYSKDQFDDDEQIKLGDFCEQLNNNGIKWVLSNSDLKNTNPDDNFFDDLYHKFNIKRVLAKRNINSNANKRGKLTELLITN